MGGGGGGRQTCKHAEDKNSEFLIVICSNNIIPQTEINNLGY